MKYAKERRQFGKAIAEFGLIKQKLAGMAIRGFVGDAMSYRTLGDVDRALETGDRADGALVLKTIEGFSVECSINKVWTSEALAWAVDEGVQVFGGNGYSREFPLERMYRDARITRIYEGTNEINRMLIPTRLLKQSPAVVQRRARTCGARTAVNPPAAGHDAALGAEREFVGRLKQLSVALLGQASPSYGDGLKDEQEVLAQIADVVIETYASESAIAAGGEDGGARRRARGAGGGYRAGLHPRRRRQGGGGVAPGGRGARRARRREHARRRRPAARRAARLRRDRGASPHRRRGHRGREVSPVAAVGFSARLNRGQLQRA